MELAAFQQAATVNLGRRFSDCIWCQRRLVLTGTPTDCTASWGPRPRSDEHIIPGNIGGKLITPDLCKCCNDQFGNICDHALVKDPRVFEPAKSCGIEFQDLWPSFEGTQKSSRGREAVTKVKDGLFRVMPELTDLQRLALPVMNGQVRMDDLNNFRHRLFQKVRLKNLSLREDEIVREVDSLLEAMRTHPEAIHENTVIDEKWGPTPLSSQVLVNLQTRPWETEWALTKILFELTQVLFPENFRIYCRPFVQEMRDFLLKREHNPQTGKGKGILWFRQLSDEAKLEHVIEGFVSPTEVRWRIVLFGRAEWTHRRKLTPIKAPPDEPVRITILNPVGPGSKDAEVVVAPVR